MFARRLAYTSLLLLAALLVGRQLSAAQLSAEQLTAAYLYNFTKFARWPRQANQPIGVCLYGSNPTNRAIAQLQDKPVAEASIYVLYPDNELQFRQCDVLYISQQEHRKLDYLLGLIDNKRVLTVSDDASFIEHGGLIQLVEQAGRLRFRINLPLLQSAELQLSSKLLRLAQPEEPESP